MERHLEVGREDGDERGGERQTGEAAAAAMKESETAGDLGGAADEDQGTVGRQPVGHDPLVGRRASEVGRAGGDERRNGEGSGERHGSPTIGAPGRSGDDGGEGSEVAVPATSEPVSRLLPVTADAPSLAPPAAPLAMELDLDCFSGPFDLLLTLVLRDELELVDVPIHEICLTYLDRIADADELDLEAATEFLILVAALLELKSRLLLPGEEDDEDDGLSPEDAAALLADRLAEYARARALAGWLADRRVALGTRVFRIDAAARVPRSHREPEPGSADPQRLAAALAVLLEPPAQVSIAHLPTRVLPVRTFVDRFRALLRDRVRIDFDEAVRGLDRMEQAVAFWAALELVRDREVVLEQDGTFAPIMVHRGHLLATRRRPDRAEPAARVA